MFTFEILEFKFISLNIIFNAFLLNIEILKYFDFSSTFKIEYTLLSF